MKAVILAAGMAKRLRPLTNDRPKCLLMVGDRCLLERTMDALVAHDITEWVVVTGYRGEMIHSFLDSHYPQCAIHYINNDVYETTNNIYSLWLARDFARGEDIVLLDSDILFDPQMITRVLEVPGSALSVNCHELGDEEMKVVVDGEGRITEISKTCRVEDAMGESVGIEKMTAEYTAALYTELDQMIEQEGLVDIFYERAFERLIPQGHTFTVVDTTDVFSMELDTVEDFERAKESLPL
jgi:choline kinase